MSDTFFSRIPWTKSQGWDGSKVLKEGVLESLIKCECSVPMSNLAHTVFYHMLPAIDFLLIQGIIHQDVKPENILYVSS